jgi:hypothetical protein
MYNNPLAFQAHALEQRTKSGARWFFWIAGLSIITSLVTFGGGSFAFFLSLGSTQVIDGFARGLANDLGEGTKIVALVFDVIIAGVFALLGWFALKRHLWSFIVGMALFALDALILLAFQGWVIIYLTNRTSKVILRRRDRPSSYFTSGIRSSSLIATPRRLSSAMVLWRIITSRSSDDNALS